MICQRDLEKTVAKRTGMNIPTIHYVLNCFKDVVRYGLLEGESVRLTNFGTFSVRPAGGKYCRNPQTGEQIYVDEYQAPKFKYSKNIKEDLRYRKTDIEDEDE